MTTAVDQSMREAVRTGIFPSAELVVAKKGVLAHHHFYGDARTGTMYDIASLTKPLATATLIMLLTNEGRLDPAHTLGEFFPTIDEAKKRITIFDLMNHKSGLPAWRPYYRELPSALVGTPEGRRHIVDACLNEPLEHAPGETTLYSDLGYIILGEIIEKAGDAPLDRLFAQRIAAPLALTDTFFVHNKGDDIRTTSRRTDTTAAQHVPVRTPALHNKTTGSQQRRFAATEDCPWRGRVIHGEVHDQNTYAMGGVAGPAGLFSTGDNIHLFITAFMRGFAGNEGLVPRATLERFFPLEGALITPPSPGTHVGGWDTPSTERSAAGHYASRNSIGHLAYTGCSIWIDQKQDFWVILLTNRIHPSTTNEKIKAFRPHIHDVIYKEIITG